jgi:hypothetical protein
MIWLHIDDYKQKIVNFRIYTRNLHRIQLISQYVLEYQERP